MSQVAVKFTNLSIADKIQKASNIVAAMDGNEHFPSPVPTLDQMRKIIQDAENAYQDSLDGGKKRLVMRDLAAKDLMIAIKSLGGYVQAASGGDQAIILSGGFGVKASASAPRHVDIPGVPVVKPGRTAGQVTVSWKPVSGARGYSMRMSHDSGETWEDTGIFPKSRVDVAGLESGARPMVQVAAFGTLGHSDWTEPGTGKVA